MAVNYAVQYEQALKQKYSSELKFNALYDSPNNRQVKWTGGKTLQVPSIDVQGMTNVDRNTLGTYTRKVDNVWVPYVLGHDREFRTLVDPMDIDETNMAMSISNITNVFNSEQKIPEMDKYMSSKLFSELGRLGVAPAPVDADPLVTFDTFMENMDNAEVPDGSRILYTTPSVYRDLKTSAALTRSLDVRDGSGAVNRSIRSLDEVEVVLISPSRMKTLYDFTSGAVVAAGARDVQMILVHPSAVLAPLKYEFASVEEPSAASSGKYLYYERAYWDVYILDRRAAGVQMAVSA